MWLRGWSKELPLYLAYGVASEQLLIVETKDADCLYGTVRHPNGHLVEFQKLPKERGVSRATFKDS